MKNDYRNGANKLAIEMAEKEQHKLLSNMMRSANNQITVTTNGKEQQIKPFDNVTIAYQSMLDKFEMTERERDIAVMTTFFESAYKTLHHDLRPRVGGAYGHFGRPTEYWVDLLEKVYNLCVKYDMTDVLFEFDVYIMDKEQYNWLIEIYRNGEE